MQKIKEDLFDQPIWISVDETTDKQSKEIGNVLIGKLNQEQYEAPYVVNVAVLDKTNAATIAHLVNGTVRELFPTFNNDLLKLFLTDGAHYMKKAGKNLIVFYPAMIHFTCISHALQRVCEIAKDKFPDVNGLVSSVKKVFLKAPLRHTLYKEICPNLQLPPEPVPTR